MAVGAGEIGFGGGRVVVSAGENTLDTGGAVSLISGYGSLTSSGAFSIRTANAGEAGTSGSISFSTGDATDGSSGALVELAEAIRRWLKALLRGEPKEPPRFGVVLRASLGVCV